MRLPIQIVALQPDEHRGTTQACCV